MRLAFAVLIALLAGAADARPRAVRTANVPPGYKALYTYLYAHLAGLETYLDTRTAAPGHQLLFGGELMPANTNRGPDLLGPDALPGVRVYLDAMQRLGIQVVNVGIGYPQIDPSFPRSTEYTAFYKNVAEEVRRRNMKLSVEMGVVFTGTPFANFDVDFSTLTVAKYREDKRTMAHTMVRELAPDYLGLVAEPDTEAGLTGLTALNDPATYASIVSRTLQGLDKGRTLIGAGIGTWGNLDFVREFVKLDIDYVDVHLYPIWTTPQQNIVFIAQIARAAGKRVTLDETWLYKRTQAKRRASLRTKRSSAATPSASGRRSIRSFFASLPGSPPWSGSTTSRRSGRISFSATSTSTPRRRRFRIATSRSA